MLVAMQTYRTNEQMMQAMKGATMALGSMNKSMNLPQLQRIAMEFERENDIMEQRQEMMDDAVDDAMDVGVEEEGDEVVDQVLEEIGIDFNQAVSFLWATCLADLVGTNSCITAGRDAYGTGQFGCHRGQGCTSGWGWRRRRRRSGRRRPPGSVRQPEEMTPKDEGPRTCVAREQCRHVRASRACTHAAADAPGVTDSASSPTHTRAVLICLGVG